MKLWKLGAVAALLLAGCTPTVHHAKVDYSDMCATHVAGGCRADLITVDPAPMKFWVKAQQVWVIDNSQAVVQFTPLTQPAGGDWLAAGAGNMNAILNHVTIPVIW